MKWIVVIFLIIIILFFLYTQKKKTLIEPEEKFPYKLHLRFFTKSEYAFYKELQKQVGDKYAIFSKVRLADFIDVDIDKYKNRSEWQIYWNKIKSKHVDFLLCDPETLKPMVAVELNGKSHQTEKVKERDEFVSRMYESVNLRFVTNHVGEDFTTTIEKIIPPIS